MSDFFAPGLFADQVALVTGGGTGIGLATARELVDLGARVAICGRRQEKVDAGLAALGAVAGGSTGASSPAGGSTGASSPAGGSTGASSPAGGSNDRVFGATCDIRDPERVAELVGQVLERFGRIDVLVNNAGGQFPSPAELMTPKGWEAVIRNNLNGTFFMTREVGTRAMIPRKRGRIVNVTAMVARGFPGMAHTGAARAGVENLTKTLAVEWAQHGIRVNAIAVGNNIRSSGTDQYGGEMLEMARKATLIKRLGTPEEVARAIVFLASHRNDFMTGTVMGFDGGGPLWGDIWPVPEPEARG